VQSLAESLRQTPEQALAETLSNRVGGRPGQMLVETLSQALFQMLSQGVLETLAQRVLKALLGRLSRGRGRGGAENCE